MTKRLEEVLKQLTAAQIEQLTQYAEALSAAQRSRAEQPPRFLSLDWVGKAADAYPEHQSGVDAAHAALEMMRQSVERSMRR